MGANSLAAAIEQSREIVASLPGNFEDIQYVARGQRVGVLRTAWGTTAPLTVRDELRLVRWRGTPMQKRLGLHSVTGTRAESIGAVEITAGSVQSSATVRVETPAAKPSLWWRLTRIR